MNKMIVCMNYTQDGSRTITDIYFDVTCCNDATENVARDYTESHDETYIIDFDPNCKPFINEIVTKGCRI